MNGLPRLVLTNEKCIYARRVSSLAGRALRGNSATAETYVETSPYHGADVLDASLGAEPISIVSDYT
jgi:hypothetical protein